jgi:hypothetical protein
VSTQVRRESRAQAFLEPDHSSNYPGPY